MRILKIWHIVVTCVALHATSSASAQQAQPADAQPPQLEQLEEGDAPAITIQRPDQRGSVVEKRARGGIVTEVEVTSGKSTYYLTPSPQSGSTTYGDSQGNIMRAPQWRIGEFDLRRKDEASDKAARDREAGPPPPAPEEPASAPPR